MLFLFAVIGFISVCSGIWVYRNIMQMYRGIKEYHDKKTDLQKLMYEHLSSKERALYETAENISSNLADNIRQFFF